MKSINKSIFLLLFTTLFVSCLKSNETLSSPECAITSFSVGDIKSRITIKNLLQDTVVTRTISGSGIKFNIDQINGLIFNVDTLPKWTDVTRICASFSASGYVYGKVGSDDGYYMLTSGSDSLNFTKPIKILSVGYDGVSTKEYTAKIILADTDIDTLVWEAPLNKDLNIPVVKKSIYNNGRIYIFSDNAEGKTQVMTTLTSGNGAEWTEQTVLKSEANIDYQSVMTYKDELYGLGADGNIYKSTSDYAVTWEKVTENAGIERILAADNKNIYVLKEGNIIYSNDFSTWTVDTEADMNSIPETCINYATYPSKTNSNMQVSVMTGINSKNSNNAVCWYKISADDPDINEHWDNVTYDRENVHALPKFKYMSMTRHKGDLYAVGCRWVIDEYIYIYLYRSKDNGVSWIALEDKYLLPDWISESEGDIELLSDGEYLWLIQNGSHLWKGALK